MFRKASAWNIILYKVNSVQEAFAKCFAVHIDILCENCSGTLTFGIWNPPNHMKFLKNLLNCCIYWWNTENQESDVFNSKEFCQTVWTFCTPRIILSKVMLKWWQLVCLRGDTVLSATSERLLLHIFCSLFWQDLGAKNLMMWLNATMFVLCWLCANFQKYAIYFSRCLKCRHSAKNLHSSHFRNYNHSAKYEGTFVK